VASMIVVVLGAIFLGARLLIQTGRIAKIITGQVRGKTTAPSVDQDKRARSAARVRILAQSVEALPVILALTMGTVLCVAAWASWRYLAGFPVKEGWCPQWSWVIWTWSCGGWLITTLTTVLVGAAYTAFRVQSSRRIIGILWDITTFWPRANHPFTPACSAERAVPQFADRVIELTGAHSDKLVLSTHSQGAIIGAAAVLRLREQCEAKTGTRTDPQHLRKVSLLTYGSPLRRLYARAFPAYFSFEVLRDVYSDVHGRWLNLWAYTDPIGGTTFPDSKDDLQHVDGEMNPDPLTLGQDPRTGEPVGVCDHSGYLSRPEYETALNDL
jgi:hypothetical protein